MLVQFAGRPGSGKSSVSRALGRELPGTVLDLDVVKTALLDDGATTSQQDAPRIAYSVIFAQAESLLADTINVIIDSPSRWTSIVSRGESIARDAGVPYLLVECRAVRSEVMRRLKTRNRSVGQETWLGQCPPEGASTQDLAAWERESLRICGPEGGWLVLDTNQPIVTCVSELLRAIATATGTAQGHGPRAQPVHGAPRPESSGRADDSPPNATP